MLNKYPITLRCTFSGYGVWKVAYGGACYTNLDNDQSLPDYGSGTRPVQESQSYTSHQKANPWTLGTLTTLDLSQTCL